MITHKNNNYKLLCRDLLNLKPNFQTKYKSFTDISVLNRCD